MQLAIKIAGIFYVLVAVGIGVICTRGFRRPPQPPGAGDPSRLANVIPFERGLALHARTRLRDAESANQAR
jgi:hypothetical protein